jgi:hypothetical protein
LDGRKADSQGALNQLGAFLSRPVRDERDERGIIQDQALDDKPVRLDADA